MCELRKAPSGTADPNVVGWIEARPPAAFHVSAFERRVLPVDAAVVARRARLHDPDRIPERDALMVATALTHGLGPVTRGAAGLAATGVICQDPWT